MLIQTSDLNKFKNAKQKKVDFFIEANKLALQVINCITLNTISDDILNCIYNKTGIMLTKYQLQDLKDSNDIRIRFINTQYSEILKYINNKYSKLDGEYILYLLPELRR